MALGRPAWAEARTTLTRLLSTGEGALRDNPTLRAGALVPATAATLHLPAAIGDYTDFYCSREHAANVGAMFRGPQAALQPNWWGGVVWLLGGGGGLGRGAVTECPPALVVGATWQCRAPRLLGRVEDWGGGVSPTSMSICGVQMVAITDVLGFGVWGACWSWLCC